MRGSTHHTLFPRRLWTVGDAANSLRGEHWLQPEMDCHVHRFLHAGVAIVPVLDNRMATHVLREFEPHHDHLQALDDLCEAVQTVIKQPRTSALEQGLGELVIFSLELQRPFIKEGIIHGTFL